MPKEHWGKRIAFVKVLERNKYDRIYTGARERVMGIGRHGILVTFFLC